MPCERVEAPRNIVMVSTLLCGNFLIFFSLKINTLNYIISSQKQTFSRQGNGVALFLEEATHHPVT